MIDLKLLIKNGVQFGHQVWRWCPRMARYIWGKKNGVHLIDVSKTAYELNRASKFLEGVAAEGKQVLWVGTKRAAQDVIQKTAEKLNQPYVRNRWIGGTLTNFPQVKKSVTKMLHYEDILSKSDQYSYTKKEFGVIQKSVDRLKDNVGGITDLAWPCGAVVVIDARKEAVAIKEARSAGIPVVALVDTNSDPSGIDFVIPGNDDVNRSIRVIVAELEKAVERGAQVAAKAKKQQAEAAELAAKNTEKKPAKKAPKKAVDKKEAAPAEEEKPAKKETKAVVKKATAKKATPAKAKKEAASTEEKPAKKAATKKETKAVAKKAPVKDKKEESADKDSK